MNTEEMSAVIASLKSAFAPTTPTSVENKEESSDVNEDFIDFLHKREQSLLSKLAKKQIRAGTVVQVSKSGNDELQVPLNIVITRFDEGEVEGYVLHRHRAFANEFDLLLSDQSNMLSEFAYVQCYNHVRVANAKELLVVGELDASQVASVQLLAKLFNCRDDEPFAQQSEIIAVDKVLGTVRKIADQLMFTGVALDLDNTQDPRVQYYNFYLEYVTQVNRKFTS